MNKTISIDLGTTNSYVAVMEGGKPVIIANTEGTRTTPSVVAFAKAGERLVGEPARHQTVTNVDKTTSSIKRHMGTDYKMNIDDKKYSPQEISATTLQKLKADAENYLGEKVTEAVTTIPEYLSNVQRQATKDAGKITGPGVKRTIDEPTAAALAYNLDNEKGQKIIVYDLDGGTLDMSVIEIDDDMIKVLSTNGSTELGGDDFDNRTTQQMIDDFKKAEGADSSAGKMALQRLRKVTEKAEKELSTVTTANINLPFITTTVEGPKHLDTDLTRAKFDELTHNLTERTAIPVQNILKDADITASELGKVLLVGGSTRMIATQEKVRQLTGQEPSKSPNPDEYIVTGVAIQGDKLTGDAGVGDILLLDVTLLSLSIKAMGGIATELIERDITIPTKKSQIFSTAADNQTVADIHVVQGERWSVRDNKTLGQLRPDGIPPVRRGAPQTEITFDIDTNGTVNISVKDLRIGKEQHIIITSGSNMSDDDIDKVVKEAAEFETQDKKRKEVTDARGDADSMVFRTGETLEEVGDKTGTNDKAVVEADLSALKEAINHAPLEEMTNAQMEGIKTGKEKLMASVQALFAKVYEAAQGAGVAGAGPDMGIDAAGGSQPDDDAVDEDFKKMQNIVGGRYVSVT